jgi:hypothetical protein
MRRSARHSIRGRDAVVCATGQTDVFRMTPSVSVRRPLVRLFGRAEEQER